MEQAQTIRLMLALRGYSFTHLVLCRLTLLRHGLQNKITQVVV